MRNPIEVLNILSEKSNNPSYRFERVYRNLYNPEFYLLAYKNIYANDGSMTPGIDNVTVDGMSEKRIERIIATLRDQSYQPNPAVGYTSPRKIVIKNVHLESRRETTNWCRKLFE